MWKIMVAGLGPACLFAPMAIAQPVTTTVGYEQGQQIYQDRCALCHQESGEGTPPTFPALNGNEQLGNTEGIVRTIRQGTGRMPPFSELTAEDISAVATYVRNAWANDRGVVTTSETTAVLAELEAVVPTVSVWDGVFSDDQVSRGRAIYPGPCGTCHGRRLNGAADDPDMRSTPPLARARFLRNWAGRSLATLFEYTRATMPESNPGSLTDEEYVDVIAYMLSVGGMPAGDAELRPDPASLAQVIIEQMP